MHKYVVANNLTIYLYVIMCCIFTSVIAFTLCTLLLEFIKIFIILICNTLLKVHCFLYTVIHTHTYIVANDLVSSQQFDYMYVCMIVSLYFTLFCLNFLILYVNHKANNLTHTYLHTCTALLFVIQGAFTELSRKPTQPSLQSDYLPEKCFHVLCACYDFLLYLCCLLDFTLFKQIGG